jgi:hypothetical protein
MDSLKLLSKKENDVRKAVANLKKKPTEEALKSQRVHVE